MTTAITVIAVIWLVGAAIFGTIAGLALLEGPTELDRRMEEMERIHLVRGGK